LEEACFEDFEDEVADVEGFDAVDAGFEDVVFEDRVRPERGGASSKRQS
jgi:hypothetical protein